MEVSLCLKNNITNLFASSEPLEPGAPDTTEYVIEECSELIQAIQHMKCKDAYQHVINEMADVYTLMDALCYHLGITESEINYYKQRLIDHYIDQPNDGRHVE